jgi:hypothetical protein
LNGNLDVSGTALVAGVLTTTAATVFNGGFASNADSTLGTDKKVQFRDAAIYINSSVDGQLDIVADTEIQIAATTIDINGTIVATTSTDQAFPLTVTNSDSDSHTYIKYLDQGGQYWTTGINYASNDFVMAYGGTNVAVFANAGGLTVTSADNLPQLTLVSTDADALVGPQLNLWRNSGSAANGDLIGQITFTGEDSLSNTITYASIHGVADQVDNGAEDGSIRFSTRFNDVLAEMLAIGSSTNGVTINDTGIDADFRVESDTDTHALFVDGSSGIVSCGTSGVVVDLVVPAANVIADQAFGINNGSNKTQFSADRINFNTGQYYVLNESNVGVILTNGNTSWAAQSDESLKENISDLGPVLDKVVNYRCVNYSLKSTQSSDADKIGFIAQDWESDFPNVVNADEDGLLAMRYTETIPVLLKAIQEQQEIIKTLEARITALES